MNGDRTTFGDGIILGRVAFGTTDGGGLAPTTKRAPFTLKRFRETLVMHGLIDQAAVEDAEGYDAGRTMQRIGEAYEELMEAQQ